MKHDEEKKKTEIMKKKVFEEIIINQRRRAKICATSDANVHIKLFEFERACRLFGCSWLYEIRNHNGKLCT